jgi:hypothetical protein
LIQAKKTPPFVAGFFLPESMRRKTALKPSSPAA